MFIIALLIPVVAIILYFVFKSTEPEKGLACLSFAFPIVGIVLYFKNKKTDVALATLSIRAAGIGMAVNAVLNSIIG